MNNMSTRTGFTLVELLLVMAIIAVLASLSLAVVNDAQQDAHANATRSRISTAHVILRQKLDSYSRRRPPFDLGGAGLTRRQQREYRRRLIADIINVEMPRRFQNVAFLTGAPLTSSREATYPSLDFLNRVRSHDDVGNGGLSPVQMQTIVDSLAAVNATALSSRFAILNDDPVSSSNNYPENGDSFIVQKGENGAEDVNEVVYRIGDSNPVMPSLAARTSVSEYLYTILETSNFNGVSAIESLGERAFGDTDGDGFMELIDSWGNPIFFQFELDLNNDEITDVYGLNPGLQDCDTPNDPTLLVNQGFAVSKIRIRLISTGNNAEIITN